MEPQNMEFMSPKEQTADINHDLVVNLREVNHAMRYLYEGKASQRRILAILDEVKRITQRDLTVRLGIQPGSASEILSKLEHAGYILRTVSETDRRTANISLTKQGEKMAQEAAVQRRKRQAELFSCLSEEEKEELLSLLKKVKEDWFVRHKTAEARKPEHAPHGHKQDEGRDCMHRRSYKKHNMEERE